MATTAQDASIAKEQAEAAKTYNQLITIAVPIAVILAVIGFLEWLVPQLADFHTLTRQSVQFQAEASGFRHRDEAQVEQLTREIQSLRDQIADVRSNRDRDIVTTMQRRISDLEVQLRLLQERWSEEHRNSSEQKLK